LRLEILRIEIFGIEILGTRRPRRVSPAFESTRRSRNQVSIKPDSRKKAHEAQKNAKPRLGFCAFCAFLRLNISSRNVETLQNSSAKNPPALTRILGPTHAHAFGKEAGESQR